MKADTVSLQHLPERRSAYLLVRDYCDQLVDALGWWRVLGSLGLLALTAAADAVTLILMGRLLTQVSQASLAPFDDQSVAVSLAAFVGSTAVRIGLQYRRDLALLSLRLDYLSGLRVRLYRALGAASWTLLARIRYSNVLSVLTSDLDRINTGTLAVLQAIVSTGVGFVTVGVAMSFSPALILPAVIVGAVLALPLLGQTARGLALGQRLTEAHRIFVASATDFLGTLKLVKAQGGAERLLQHVARAGEGLDAETIAFTRDQGRRTVLMQAGALLLVAGLLLYGVWWLRLPLPILLLGLYLLARLVPLLHQVANYAQLVTHMLPAWRAFRDLEARLVLQSDGPFDTDSVPPSTVDLLHGIELVGVRFRYPEADHPALDGIDLYIPARKTMALVGVSGAGKTSLIDTVLGLLEPDEGRVLIDSLALDAQLRRDWQQAVAYVPQETVLLPVSVRQNLLWNHADANEEALWQALDQAQAAEFVRRLPDGLDTVLGEQGSGLSGGERQRLMLARALLRRPQLLVLDEATSHLDAHSERCVREALRGMAGHLTVLMIAHRMSTVKDADHIVLIDRGRVVASGSWDELHATQPLFRRLVRADDAVLVESP